jgi:mono/diheme cytochrome c family protein
MKRGSNRWGGTLRWLAAAVVAFITTAGAAEGQVDQQQVLWGRQLVMESACGGCHGGLDPSSDGWLAGFSASNPFGFAQVGPYATYARNLTPDNTTGMGRFSERQIFNALRYGLRPGETPDMEITSTTPGEGNFPVNPKYLAPPMPWAAWRHRSDDELWAIAAYLKHGVKPVRNRVEDSDGPPDFWASIYTEEEIGTYPAVAFPTASETLPADGTADLDKVLRGRLAVIRHDCGGCHGGGVNPASERWLIGMTSPEEALPFGACLEDPAATPCYMNRPRNLTPDIETGVGAYTERQIFNALRFGLSPRATADGEIRGGMAGHGNFPDQPTYLGPWMPWTYWRHMPDEDLWAIAAYLKYGLKPKSNHVDASDAPPDAWASEYTAERIGTFPAPAFPTVNETGR